MAIELIDLVSNFKAGIDVYKRLKVALSDVIEQAGFAVLAAEVDPGDNWTGGRYITALDADDDYRLRVAADSLDFQETWAGVALNSAQWSSTVTTMATAVGGGYLKLNSGNNAAVSTVARVQSYRTFSLEHAFPLYIDIPIQYVAASLAMPNTQVEMGWGISTGVAQPTDGVFLRCDIAGQWRLVAYYGASENQSDPIDMSNVLAVNSDAQVLLVINTIEAELFINNKLKAKVERPAATPGIAQSLALPITFRVYNHTVAPASAVQLWIGPVTVSRGGAMNARQPVDFYALNGWGGYQGQSGGTMGYTANSVHSTAPASATLAAATAGYTTFGGQFQFAAVAGAETDYALFAWQVPAAVAGSFNKNFLLKGIRIDATVLGAAIATTATILQWQVGVGASAVTLATVADTATAKQSRRAPLGIQSFMVGDPIGARLEALVVDLSAAPMLAEPGTYVHVILKIPVGTATASQIIRGTVLLRGQHIG